MKRNPWPLGTLGFRLTADAFWSCARIFELFVHIHTALTYLHVFMHVLTDVITYLPLYYSHGVMTKYGQRG